MQYRREGHVIPGEVTFKRGSPVCDSELSFVDVAIKAFLLIVNHTPAISFNSDKMSVIMGTYSNQKSCPA